MKVVVTREAGWNDEAVNWLPPGITVNEVPLTTTEYVDPDEVRAALHESPAFGNFRTLVVTSARSVKYVDIALAASAPQVTICAVGPTTAAALGDRGVKAHTRGDDSAESLSANISSGPVLMLGAKAMRPELASALRAKALEVVTIACYQTIPLSLDPGDVTTLGEADVVLIGAPSAWSVARESVNALTWVVVPGATTAAAVCDDHPRVIEGWGPDLATRLADLFPAG